MDVMTMSKPQGAQIYRTGGKRKRFDCGHLGRGRFCHRCEQAARLMVTAPEGGEDAGMRAEAKRLYAVPSNESNK